MTLEPGPPDDSPLTDEPQTIAVRVDVSGLPAVMALARAARDVIDHAEQDDDHNDLTPFDTGVFMLIPTRDFAALRAAVQPIYPGPAT